MKLTFYIRTIGIIAVIALSVLPVFSQNNANKGDRYFDKNLFTEAIKYYRLEAKSGNRRYANYAKQRLAVCYRILGEFEMAEEMYKKLLKSKRNREDPTYYLNYGKSLKSSAKYAEAKIQFNQYIKLKPGDPMGKVFLYSCDSAQIWLEETIGKEVKNIEKINTPSSDFAPVFLASNQLVFSSSREGAKEALISFDGGMKVDRLDLYYANLNALDGEDDVKQNYFSAINSPLHEGSATFSVDGKEIYFTRTIKGKKAKDDKKIRKGKKREVLSTLQVFYSKIDSTGNWSEPVSAFSFNSTKYSIGQPSLSKDGEKIFFISDMKGGYGGTDIYFSEKRENGSWIEPINVGSDVNTFGYELFPYISDNDVLYFSSDSHIGMGKLDIFSSEDKNGEWVNVQNLKPPFNSIGNDFGIVFDQRYSRGFFSSDRFNGKGAEDIYSFSENIPPLVITINGNKLEFSDNSVFDGLKYTLRNITTKKDTTLSSLNGLFSYFLQPNDDYELLAKKNRFSVHNKIEIKVMYDNLENYLKVKIKSNLTPIRLNGYLTIPDENDTTNTKRVPIKNKYLKLSDTATVEIMKSTATGYYQFKSELNQGREYTITGSKFKLKEEVIMPTEELNVPDSIFLTGVVEDQLGNPLEGKVIVRNGSKIVQEFMTDIAGNFNIKLPRSEEYEVVLTVDGYYPGVKNIHLKNSKDKKQLTTKFRLSLISE